MPLSYVYRGSCRFCSTPLERVLAYRWDGGHDCFSVDCDTDDCDKRESIVDLVGVRRGDGTLVPIEHYDGWKILGEASDDEFDVIVSDYVGTGGHDLRSRIDGYCVRYASEDDGEWTVTAAFDGIEVEHSIDALDRDEAVEVALAGLRIDWVRREIERRTATAADIRVALEDAPVLGWEGEDSSDLEEAFLLLASEKELDAWRAAKVKRLADEMGEAEAEYRANPFPVLVDRRAVS